VKYVWTERPFAAANIWHYVLKPAAEQALKPKDSFRECILEQSKDHCPSVRFQSNSLEAVGGALQNRHRAPIPGGCCWN